MKWMTHTIMNNYNVEADVLQQINVSYSLLFDDLNELKAWRMNHCT